jgi:hypothetical protein
MLSNMSSILEALMAVALVPSLSAPGPEMLQSCSPHPCRAAHVCVPLCSEMKEGSERCDGPMCDGMAINVRGDILRYPKVSQQHQRHNLSGGKAPTAVRQRCSTPVHRHEQVESPARLNPPGPVMCLRLRDGH